MAQKKVEEEVEAPVAAEAKPFDWRNPGDLVEADVAHIAGVNTPDEGDLEFVPGNFAGVSQDRMFKASNSHGYPAWSAEEIAAEEERVAEIDRTNKAREAERAETAKVEDKKAAKRLRDLVNGV